MKRCPNCDKEFPDSMRFCQTDGTPLVEAAKNEPPPDPYKTVVGSIKMDDDLLQLPEQDDPMKTMVSPSFSMPKPEVPKPIESPKPENNSPEPRSSASPANTPPGFGDVKSSSFGSPFDSASNTGSSDSANQDSPAPPKPFNDTPKFDSAPPKNDSPFGSSPFDKPGSKSDSPFGQPPAQSSSPFDKPASSSPFDKPAPPPPPPMSASGSGSPFDKAPPPPYKESPPPSDKSTSPFGGSPFDSPSSAPKNDPFQKNEWTPPPAPVSNWQDQGLGAHTPFQPPAVGATGGQNQTLGIVSLVLGLLGLLCLGFLTGIPALVTGFMTLKNVKRDPATYGGKVLAIIGMVTGALGTLWSGLYLLFILYVMIMNA